MPAFKSLFYKRVQSATPHTIDVLHITKNMTAEKNHNKKTWLTISSTLSLLLLFFFLYLIGIVLKTDNDDFRNVAIFNNVEIKNDSINFSLTNFDTIVLEDFSFNEYLRNTDLQDPSVLNNDLEILKNKTKNEFQSNSIISKALTLELHPLIWSTNLDTINQIMLWVDKLDFRESNIKESIEIYWYNHIVNYLSKQAKERPNQKYAFKYRYIKQQCIQKNFLIDSGNSKIEKVFLNAIDKNWSYIFNRFWLSTSWKYKVILLIGFIPLLILFILGVKHFIFLIKTKK